MPHRAVHDEGPSPDDLVRFDHDLGYCPECGNRVHDDADLCPECGAWITGEVSSRPPVHGDLKRRTRIFVALMVLLGFLVVGALGFSIF